MIPREPRKERLRSIDGAVLPIETGRALLSACIEKRKGSAGAEPFLGRAGFSLQEGIGSCRTNLGIIETAESGALGASPFAPGKIGIDIYFLGRPPVGADVIPLAIRRIIHGSPLAIGRMVQVARRPFNVHVYVFGDGVRKRGVKEQVQVFTEVLRGREIPACLV